MIRTELKNSVQLPIPELFTATKLLAAAVSAHEIGKRELAGENDMISLRDPAESKLLRLCKLFPLKP